MSTLGKRALVAYHANCIDGFTACWVAVTALEKKGVKVDTLGMEYNQGSCEELHLALLRESNHDEDYSELYIVDFSVPINWLERYATLQELRVTVLDHHKTAFEIYAPDMEIKPASVLDSLVYGAEIKLRNHMSGAAICWVHFNPEAGYTPNIITYTEDYDLWRFHFGDKTKYINKYLVAQPKTLREWDRIATRMDTAGGMSKILGTGKRLQGLHDKAVQQTAQMAIPIELCNYKGLTVHCPPELTSDVGHTLATKSGTFGATYTVVLGENRIKWSLRSNDDFDVSTIAKYYGGGGHKNAAGFETKLY